MLVHILSENVIGKRNERNRPRGSRIPSIHSIVNWPLLVGNCFFPKGLDSLDEVSGPHLEQKSLFVSVRKQRQALAFSFQVASPAGAISVAFLLLLQPSSGIRAWLQALVMTFNPGPAQRRCEQRHVRGLPTPIFSKSDDIQGKRLPQLFTWWWCTGKTDQGLCTPILALPVPPPLPLTGGPVSASPQRYPWEGGRPLTSPHRAKSLAIIPKAVLDAIRDQDGL